MKKEIMDFIGAITRIYNPGDCVCFEAEEIYPYFMALSQDDIDFFNKTLQKIIETEKNEKKEYIS